MIAEEDVLEKVDDSDTWEFVEVDGKVRMRIWPDLRTFYNANFIIVIRKLVLRRTC